MLAFLRLQWAPVDSGAGAAVHAMHSKTTGGNGVSAVTGRVCSCSQGGWGVRALRGKRRVLGIGLRQGEGRHWSLFANDDKKEAEPAKEEEFVEG